MKLRAIVFEDDRNCQKLISLLLEQKGYEVMVFSGALACPLFSDAECTCPTEASCGDFLLTDNRMPGMTGLDFVESQTHRGCKGIVGNKAIFSATWTTQELARAELLGCKIFRKPFDLREISRWLEERERVIPPARKLVDFSVRPEY